MKDLEAKVAELEQMTQKMTEENSRLIGRVSKLESENTMLKGSNVTFTFPVPSPLFQELIQSNSNQSPPHNRMAGITPLRYLIMALSLNVFHPSASSNPIRPCSISITTTFHPFHPRKLLPLPQRNQVYKPPSPPACKTLCSNTTIITLRNQTFPSLEQKMAIIYLIVLKYGRKSSIIHASMKLKLTIYALN